MKNIIVTGGNGRFASSLKKYFYGENVFYLSKKYLYEKMDQLEMANPLNYEIHVNIF